MLRDKLHRLSDHVTHSNKSSKNDYPNERYRRLSDILGGELDINNNGTFIRIISEFRDTYNHGRTMLMDLDPSAVFKTRHFGYDDPSEYAVEKLLFLDTETTGLGGSGTVAFLVGVGSVTKDGFRVRQYFLPDFSDEEAMLEAVREEIKADTVLVTYNGKAFDMPILADRMIIQRVERNLKAADHIDLLHTVRRLYRRRLKDCSLSNIERNILEFYREDDLPGHLVPSVYFNWLATDSTDLIDKIAEHNLNDIISLFFLMHHLQLVQVDPAGNIREPDDVLSLARILERRREHEHICGVLEDFRDLAADHRRYDILLIQSLAYKRRGCWPEAAALWDKIANRDCPEAFAARIELAKYFEHRLRDPQKALYQALEARKICPARPALAADVQKRINRLTGKS
nr:ribonuclease H-like domain-containing protein [candidate division Zixibacteria bacterium]